MAQRTRQPQSPPRSPPKPPSISREAKSYERTSDKNCVLNAYLADQNSMGVAALTPCPSLLPVASL
ncbi:hypothetical protein PI124_g12811 [Phytophthora idaei]|nr:hypothetical protein PI125_g5599 [Phytophthora idaei]KAG3153747.1 hypothetical protein PI126_g9920 [Phytophthora idaei]KAG3242336.1 hypothetical protein PI124_g12811 [Phytophthora idaei]